ncbi:PRC-barrel domain-containing protein [Rhodoblastus sp.]|uniref:PRC-barrel domain-containing protein n=1 Tax=Rhodoblastus sp. TaxID=1962975 RepID=UPI003F98B798
MKIPVLAAAAGLALTQVAYAQTSNAQPQPNNAQSQSKGSIRQDIKSSLERSGFRDINIEPEAFFISAKDKSGNPVMISVDPNSFEEVTAYQAGEPNGANQSKVSSQKIGMFTTVPSSDKLSSNLVGLSVYNNANQDIGTVKDISLDQNGVQAYILAVGGFLGMGDHYVAVNPSALNITYNSTDKKWHAAMNATADQLKAAPEFKYSGVQHASNK